MYLLGFLVPDYLNYESDKTSYVKAIENNAKNYNPFNLLLYEMKKYLLNNVITIFGIIQVKKK